MKKELKQQIREDEFRTGLAETAGWLTTHSNEARVTAFVLAVVVLGAWGFQEFRTRRNEKADRAFQDAAEIYRGPLASEITPGAPAPGTVYATAAEKYQKALAAFDAVAREHGNMAPGRRAQYYAALCRIELGQMPEAEKDLTALAGRRDADPLVAGLARLALGDLYGRTGQTDKAVEQYRLLVDDSNAAVPRDHALMRLAAAQEAGQRAADARASYRKLVEEFPSSVYVSEARKKADLASGAAPAGPSEFTQEG